MVQMKRSRQYPFGRVQALLWSIYNNLMFTAFLD